MALWAFGLSFVLHAAAILFYPLLIAPPEPGSASPAAADLPAPAGTEIVRLLEVPEDELERPEEPRTERVPVPTPPVRAAPAEPGEAEGEEAAEPVGPTAAERVRASGPDVRLIAPLSDDVVGLSREQIAELELRWALESLNDSAAAAAEAARRALDWTFTDADGKRWGVSPGKLHLGDLTLPLPQLFGAPYDPNAWKGSMDADLERAAGSAAARETLDERARAIRERKDREREEQPDTTREGGGG